jgi:TPR repeat protein
MKAAEKISPCAEFILSYMYEYGFGVEKKLLANHVMFSSEKKSNEAAQNNVRYMYETGHGVGPVDYAKAK